jgi:hypothetical protein
LLVLLLLDAVDLPAEVFAEFFEEVDFDFVAGFFAAAADVAGFVDWAAIPPVVVNASREPTTTANRTFELLPTLALTS